METLYDCANTERCVVAIPLPNHTDDPDLRSRLVLSLHELDDLVSLGLMEDISGKLLRHIEWAARASGRKQRLFLITTLGFDMSHGHGSSPPH